MSRLRVRGWSRLWPATLGLCLAGCPSGEGHASSKTSASPTPAPTPTTPEGILDRVVTERCLRPDDPWALAHAILVYGKDVKTPDGSLAVERLVGDNLGGGMRFPSRRNGWPLEPHPGMFVKTLIEVGVAPARSFAVKGGRRVTLQELARAYVEHYQGPVGEELPFHNQAWLLEVCADVGDERVEALREHALGHLEAQQRYLEPWLKDPSRPYRKPAVKGKDGRPRPAYIHRYFCGGLHFFQGVQRLFGREVPPRLRHQYEILLLRLKLETRYWVETLAKVRKRYGPERRERVLHTRRILAQRLKVQGHILETWCRGLKQTQLTATPDDTQALAAGFDALAATVTELQSEGCYAALDELRDGTPGDQQLYRDLIGDSAHALHAYHLR